VTSLPTFISKNEEVRLYPGRGFKPSQPLFSLYTKRFLPGAKNALNGMFAVSRQMSHYRKAMKHADIGLLRDSE
jgi:hypothetical protein